MFVLYVRIYVKCIFFFFYIYIYPQCRRNILFLDFFHIFFPFIPKSTVLINNLSFREFEVDSINFAGQTHRWRLSGLLQRGRDRRRDALLRDLALATRFLVVTAKARLVSHCFSVSQSLKALLTGLLRLLGMNSLRKSFLSLMDSQEAILFKYNWTLLRFRYYNWRTIASST